MIAKLCMGMTVAAAILAPASAATSKLTLRDKQNAACFQDVQRLCGAFVPDEDTTSACMRSKRAQISPACAKFYPDVPAK